MEHSRINRSFKRFIDQDKHFTENEQTQILSSFIHRKNHKIFYLSVILLMWSLIGAIIESILLGGGTVASIIDVINYSYFMPAILFFIFNFIAKIFFALWYVRKYISVYQALCCGIPYIGGPLVLGFLLKNDKLFLKGLLHYLKYLKKHGFIFIYNFFKSN